MAWRPSLPQLIVAMAVVCVVPPGGAMERPIHVRPRIVIIGATSEQLQLAGWAIARFEAAGLELPALRIRFHGGSSGCAGHLGYYLDGAIDLCAGMNINLSSRRYVLHELAHAWAETSLSGRVRGALLRERGLPTWNDAGYPWRQRGSEHAAEILGWGLGEGVLTPTIPDHAPARLAVGYRLLTGTSPPVLER